MPMLALMRLMSTRGGQLARFVALLCLGLQVASCQSQSNSEATPPPPPVGHYEGSITVAGQPEVRAALDIRHPSPGHYEAELSVPTTGTLSFVSDTIVFRNNQLQFTRPARPSQVLTLTQEGDFWRGSLMLDSTKAEAILLKRGAPTPSTYRVEELPQDNGSAWLFSPSDTGTPGAALLLLPDAATAPAAALWADALAREGLIVLVLPATDSAAPPAEAPRLQAALRLLRSTPGADTASIGVWATGGRASAVAQVLAAPDGPRTAFVIAQNAALDPTGRDAFRALKKRKLPVLGLFGGAAFNQQAATLRNALGGRRGATVRTYRTTGPDLLIPDGLSPRFGPGLPNEVVEWLRGATAQ
ncbi:hypothetical protein I2I05_13955 [Hymenobacter sp. BT683]|uniref:Dienelactone hydrolase domain-containing protein n=1 Tax=Hymenobacter jeongseonensis TaxID=2791027 RepID=A0ABS0IL65_9BACT|nr:hypothetical protein [Hymenobacter jeongseonensis]MBF9238505.1 hypothetical protein [Hymenobacter jeongseonensis]